MANPLKNVKCCNNVKAIENKGPVQVVELSQARFHVDLLSNLDKKSLHRENIYVYLTFVLHWVLKMQPSLDTAQPFDGKML